MKPRIVLFVIISIAGIASIVATGPSPKPPSSPPSTHVKIFYPIPLGNGSNVVSIGKPIFLGHRVQSFRLRVRFENPGRTAHWLGGVKLSLRDQTGNIIDYTSLPSTASSDGSFWTDVLAGNRAWLGITSTGFVDFLGGQPRLEILEIDRSMSPSSTADEVPSLAETDPGVLGFSNGFEAVALPPAVSEALHYNIFVWDSEARNVGIYVSPFLPELWNDVGLRVAISTSGYKPKSDQTGWLRPDAGDSGVYAEISVPPHTRRLFVTISTVASAPYLLAAQRIRKRFGGIVMERDEDIAQPAEVDTNGLMNATSREFPYGKQFHDYIFAHPDVDKRIRQMMVIASAHMLDASDGMFRFRKATLHRNISWTRNVDVQFQKGSGRANTTWTRINMFQVDELNDPLTGGWTFNHEWGHWKYSMPDEYVDVSGPPPVLFSLAIDGNSIMGTSASSEFCNAKNHLGLAGDSSVDTSMWSLLQDQFDVLPSLDSGGLKMGRYMDVLHQLDDLLELTVL